VGSLISKDFLHKARAWDLDKTASVCPGCTQGCNVTLETRENLVLRIRPRPNAEVNRHFMCDEGRFGYRWLNRADRLEVPMVREGDRLVAADWDRSLERAAALLREVQGSWVGLVSPGASCEALGQAMKLLRTAGGGGAFRVREGPEQPLAGVADLALRAERAPNVHGALEAGFTRDWAATVQMAKGAGLVLVLDEPLEGVEGPHGRVMIHIGTTLSEAARHHAAVVLPSANMAEEEGTFRNLRGRVQRYFQASTPPGMARPADWILREILAALVGAGAAV
jgi:NADH-quinone oxidoreductase subunit G